MGGKIKNIVNDFLNATLYKEKAELFLIPLIPPLMYFIIYKYLNVQVDIYKFAVDFNDNVLNISALLSAFGVASVSIIMTSGNKNVEVAKIEYYKERKNSDGIPINYYQFILIKNYYNIMVQFMLLILSVFLKFIIFESTSLLIVLIELYMLLHAIFIQLSVICTMYYLVWKDKTNE